MAVPGTFTVGQILTAAEMNALGAMSTITVTATNLPATVTARGYIFQNIAFVEINAAVTGAATGNISFTLPAGYEIAVVDTPLGNALFVSTSSGINYNGIALRGGSNLTVGPRVFDNGATYTRYTRTAVANATVPFTWANGDTLKMWLNYRIA